MYLLGAYLPDNKLVRIALTSFYGISHETAKRLCARLQLHKLATVASLSEGQITALSAYISSPSSIAARTAERTSAYPGAASTSQTSSSSSTSKTDTLPASQRSRASDDPLRSLVLESDLRRELLANIAHHRTIGSYVGRRHVAGLPVRGQRTRSNAITARRLNKVDRRGMATWAARRSPTVSTSSSRVMDIVRPLLHLRFPKSL